MKNPVVSHAHRAVQGSIPVSQTFTARISEGIGITLESAKRTSVVRSECSLKFPPLPYRLQPPSRGANTVSRGVYSVALYSVILTFRNVKFSVQIFHDGIKYCFTGAHNTDRE